MMKLLILSNGHGEDVIAARILEQLQQYSHISELAVLPLVGEGHAYKHLSVTFLGQVKKLPSGGFVYMDGRQLWRDIRGGLLALTQRQYQLIRQWARQGGKILAVGDILPLLLAWLSGADYAFVGTAKSEYYLRDERGWLPDTPWFYHCLGSYYFPWERKLMSHPRCRAVFARDSLTGKILRQMSVPAFDLGNPMMDGLKSPNPPGNFSLKSQKFPLQVLLLPGSRSPEAMRNWEIILAAVSEIVSAFRGRQLTFLAALCANLPLDPFQESLLSKGWQSQPAEAVNLPVGDPQASVLTQRGAQIILSQNAYADCLNQAQIGIAMAGTATEQFIGLGKPAFIIPGQGPQFTPTFAEAQSRLLGLSVILVPQPAEIAGAIKSLFNDPHRWQDIVDNGVKRMGKPGAAKRIAQCLMEKLAPA
jgi:uncharacterized protein (TIGR03492 family)